MNKGMGEVIFNTLNLSTSSSSVSESASDGLFDTLEYLKNVTSGCQQRFREEDPTVFADVEEGFKQVEAKWWGPDITIPTQEQTQIFCRWLIKDLPEKM